jgi:serine/threonine-protein kinase
VVNAAAAAGPALRPAYDSNNQPVTPAAPAGPPTNADKGRNVGQEARKHTRRVLVVAGAVVILGLGTYGWSLANGRTHTGNQPGAIPQPSVVPASGKCVVSYAVWSDAGGRFSAQLTVANRNDTPIKAWKLWFIMPGDQVVSGNGKVPLSQAGNTVTVSSTGALNPQKALTMPITGRYAEHNNAPLAFMLNDRSCETFVSSKPGEPSRQVEHLSNGGVRLGATPSTTAPVPGISIDPGGIVHITPTTKPAGPTTGPTKGTPPTTQTTPPDDGVPTDTAEPGPPTDPPTTTPPTTPATTAPTVPVTTPPMGDVDCDVVDPTCTPGP